MKSALTIVAVAVLLGITACSPTPQPAHAAVKAAATRHKAPEFDLKDQAGNIVHIADYKGKVVLLDFWATWCGPCNIEIPWFKEFESKYKDRGFEVVGVSMDEAGWKAIAPFAVKKKMNYKIVLGDEKTGDQYGGIEALPTAFIIDREGRVAAVHVGLSARKEFQDAIEQLL
jgi:cytochrome c biogenesis protein CcmG/thiol:disulfide interchange protein DsbE